MVTTEDVLAIARGELGVTESPAGSNNVKYNIWYYGKEVSGSSYPWCMAFVQWVFAQAGVKLPARTASCGALVTAAKTERCWITQGYRPGDIVIYDFSGARTITQHCGIVTEAGSETLTSIEGNTGSDDDANGGAVMERVRSMRYVVGAVRPPLLDLGEVVEQLTDAQLVRLSERLQAALGRLPLSAALQDDLQDAVSAGITNGARPNAFCTRAQAAVMAARAGK